MAEEMKIEMVSPDSITPYTHNPRDNTLSVDKVAESIKEFGFRQPIVCDGDGVIIAGHTRYEAAKKLGLREVPVLYARDLSPEMVRAYRLADNKVGEESRWLNDLLAEEMEAVSLEVDFTAFGFDDPSEYKGKESWKTAGKLCNLKKEITAREKAGFFYTSFFRTGKDGRPISEIKEDETLVAPFAGNLADYVQKSLGGNLAGGGWCICTTPRRRHTEGFHFATEICRRAAGLLGIPFYEGIVTAKNHGRIDTEFTLARDPAERNVLLYDDIISTGITLRDTRKLLTEKGHCVLTVVAIRNQ